MAKILNLILSTTGSNINIDVSWWAQILQWVVMKLTFHVYMDVNSDYENSTWCWNVIGHVENSNFNVENTLFLDVENTSVFYVFQIFTSIPNLDVKKPKLVFCV